MKSMSIGQSPLKLSVLICLIICLGMLLPACMTPSSSQVKQALPAIVELSSNPQSMLPYQVATLRWTVTDAVEVSIDQDIRQVDPVGTRIVFPTENTTYTLTATNSAGTVAKSITVYVCHTCGCYRSHLPSIDGYQPYVDYTNCFDLLYPSTWDIDKERFSTLNRQAGGVLSGVSFSNANTGGDYSYLDVLIEVKGPDFNLVSFASRYKNSMEERGYKIVSERVFPDRGSVPDEIRQTYDSVRNGIHFESEVRLTVHDGKFWTIRWDGPKVDFFRRICNSFNFLRDPER